MQLYMYKYAIFHELSTQKLFVVFSKYYDIRSSGSKNLAESKGCNYSVTAAHC